MNTFIVTSKVKKAIKDASFSGMNNRNTAAEVLDCLSDHVGKLLLKAVENSHNDGRKTVMKRDIEQALREFRRESINQ